MLSLSAITNLVYPSLLTTLFPVIIPSNRLAVYCITVSTPSLDFSLTLFIWFSPNFFLPCFSSRCRPSNRGKSVTNAPLYQSPPTSPSVPRTHIRSFPASSCPQCFWNRLFTVPPRPHLSFSFRFLRSIKNSYLGKTVIFTSPYKPSPSELFALPAR